MTPIFNASQNLIEIRLQWQCHYIRTWHHDIVCGQMSQLEDVAQQHPFVAADERALLITGIFDFADDLLQGLAQLLIAMTLAQTREDPFGRTPDRPWLVRALPGVRRVELRPAVQGLLISSGCDGAATRRLVAFRLRHLRSFL